MNLVIVETPAQAKCVANVLGENWQVEPCYGAVRDLPADTLGVDVRHDFRPTYTLLPRKGNLVRRLMRDISKADAVYIATPPDRAGEATGWHLLALSPVLENKPVYRILLKALIPDAIRAAFDNPRSLDMNAVEAEETRRIADRLVGYLVSPLASKALNAETSLSLVDMVCLGLLVERERAISSFTSDTTWILGARLTADETEFEVRLCNANGSTLTFNSQQQADKLAALLANVSFWVDKAAVRARERPAPQAYTSQTLLAEAALHLGFAPNRLLSVAQTLYEAGWITFPNTDSVAATSEAVGAGRAYILREFGTDYLPTESGDPNAPIGMECIRPTDVSHLPEDLPGDGAILYGLIWRRFVASCMTSAQYRLSAARIFSGVSREKPFPFEFRTQGRMLAFDGWQRVLSDRVEAEHGSYLPQISDGTPLKLIDVHVYERASQVPARYTSAGLIATLLAHGFGRPAVWVSAVNSLTNSGHVQIGDERIMPTENGIALAGFIATHFADVLSLGASIDMERAFERVAKGETNRPEVLQQFWTRFSLALGAAAQGVLNESVADSAPSRDSHEHRPIVLRPLAEG
jgi:DNA topoisomerase-1